ncbi:MAG: type II secretion system F family protein [Bdellovibrionota bacterium]
MNVAVIVASGFCFFLAAYLPFATWEEIIWRGKILGTRDTLKKEYEDLFKLKSEAEVLKEILIWGFVLGILTFIVMPGLILGVVTAVVLFFFGIRIPLILAKTIVKKRRIARFTTQMVDALTLMANGLRSGLNVPQTLQIVVDEMPAPVSQEFGLVLDQNRIGVPLEAAFENMAKRINTEEIYIFSTSVNILRETGGNMAETFDTIVKTIRERMKLAKKIDALTAQGRTAGLIVGMVPFGTAGMMFIIDPEFIRPLFTTIPGFFIVLVVLALVAAGLYIINRMVQIKV